METCSECHAGIQLDDDLVRSRLVIMPGCLHLHAAPDAMDTVVLFPGVGPVLLLPFGDPQIADRAEPAEMPERLPYLLNRLGSDVGRIEERSDNDRLARIDGKIVTIRVLCERLLDRNALIEAV